MNDPALTGWNITSLKGCGTVTPMPARLTQAHALLRAMKEKHPEGWLGRGNLGPTLIPKELGRKEVRMKSSRAEILFLNIKRHIFLG